MKYDVFISYSRKDTAIANRICEALDRAHISYFIDRQGIAGGFEFPTVLANAILESRIILYLASENSYASKFTNAELTFAFNEKPKNSILPYIIDGSELPSELRFVFSSINWRTMRDYPIETALIADLKTLLQGAALSPQGVSKKKSLYCWWWLAAAVAVVVGAVAVWQWNRGVSSTEVALDEAVVAKYRVGDYYNENGLEGVIFALDSTGNHGKIVSLPQTEERIAWCRPERSFREGVFATTDAWDGAKNQAKIETLPMWQQDFPAFAWCAALGEGWYLPAIEELKLFTEQDEVRAAVNQTLASHGAPPVYDKGEVTTYWSSTESDTPPHVWFMIMSLGQANPFGPRSNVSHVRAVAAF